MDLSNLRRGKYTLDTYKIGYRINDACATCHDLGVPNRLIKEQIAENKARNSGASLELRTVTIGRDGQFAQQFEIRENDAVLITLKRRR